MRAVGTGPSLLAFLEAPVQSRTNGQLSILLKVRKRNNFDIFHGGRRRTFSFEGEVLVKIVSRVSRTMDNYLGNEEEMTLFFTAAGCEAFPSYDPSISPGHAVKRHENPRIILLLIAVLAETFK